MKHAFKQAGLCLALALGFAPLGLNLSWAQEQAAGENAEQKQIIVQFLDIAFNAYIDKNYEVAATYFIKILQINPSEEAAIEGVKQCKKKLSSRLKEGEESVENSRKLARKKEWIEAIDNINFMLAQSPHQIYAWELKNEIRSDLEKSAKRAKTKNESLMYEGLNLYLQGRSYEAISAWSQIPEIEYGDMPIQRYVQKVGAMLGYGSYAETINAMRRNTSAPAISAVDVALKSDIKGPRDSFYDTTSSLANSVDVKERSKPLANNTPAATVTSNTPASSSVPVAKAKNESNTGNSLAENLLDSSAATQPVQEDSASAGQDKQNLIGDYYDKGVSLMEQNKIDESLEQWNKILQLDPKNEVALNYSKKLLARGAKTKTPGATNNDAATNTTNVKQPTATTVAPKKATVVENVPAPVDKLAQAIANNTTPGPAAPNVSAADPVNLDEGVALYKKQDFVKAIAFFESVLKRDPENQDIKEWLEKIKKDQAEQAKQHYNQGLLFFTQGNTDKAILEWQQVLTIDPENMRAKSALSKAQRK